MKIVDALDLAKATMAKVHQNLAWAVAYNAIAVPIAAGVLLPHFDFAMTPSLSGMPNFINKFCIKKKKKRVHLQSSLFNLESSCEGLTLNNLCLVLCVWPCL